MQFKIEGVADNLANADTEGYKRKEISFQELLNNDEINAGSKTSVGKTNFKQGNLIESPFSYHMAIEGRGFFGVLDENNNLMLTRNGGFHINSDRSITDESGFPLVVDYYIPSDEWNEDIVSISSNGEIIDPDNSTVLGKIVLFYPENMDSLVSLGEGRYMPGEDLLLYNSLADEEGFGNIRQYFLESSNVDMLNSITELITTQRAYSLNAKAVQTTDDLMSMINHIKR